MNPKVLFLTLNMFGFTGGIEKVCQIFGKVLTDMSLKLGAIQVYSLYDKPADHDSKYICRSSFRAFRSNRFRFGISSMLMGIRSDIVVMSHVNLSIAALLIKTLSPKTRIILYAHGTEVWENLPWWKSAFLRKYCEVWAVSEFTAEKLREFKNANPEKIRILPNCLDPFLKIPSTFSKPGNLLKRYQLAADQPVLFTLGRLLSNASYKGTDRIIENLAELIKLYPNIRFLVAGKGGKEKARLEELVNNLELAEHVIFTGFIPDEELSDYFRLADIFIMPSQKEGFGIVFIEAAACGCKVIGGNQDGSRQALLDGKLGTLIHPEKKEELLKAIKENLENLRSENSSRKIQSMCLEHFNYDQYLKQVQGLLLNELILRSRPVSVEAIQAMKLLL